MASRIGYNVHSTTGGNQRPWSDQELTHFFEHLDRLQPTTLLFLDRREWALEARRRLPNCRVIFRKFYDDGGANEGNMWAKKDANWHVDTFARDAEGGLALNIWNEPIPGGDAVRTFAERYAAVMDAFGALHIPIVGPNFGVGFPNENWMTQLEPMWQAFDRWSNLHDYGIHEYGTHRGMLFNESGSAFNVFPYRIGRQTDFCTVPHLISRGGVIPPMVFTEWGVDAAFDGTNFRGWRTCWDENRYGQELIEADRKISTSHPYIRGFCIFSYGDTGRVNTSDDWSSFNVIDAFTVQQQLEANATAPVAPPPIVERPIAVITQPIKPPPVNQPALKEIAPPVVTQPIKLAPPPVWKTATAKLRRGAYVNVRDTPGLSGKSVGRVYPDMEVLYEEQKKDNWWHVKLGDQEGYALADYFDLIPAAPNVYRFPLVLTIHAESQESARRLADYLTSRLVMEYENLKDAEGVVSQLPSEFTVSTEG